jgi:membrane-associated protease RseP (regulator of RpoE activity)
MEEGRKVAPAAARHALTDRMWAKTINACGNQIEGGSTMRSWLPTSICICMFAVAPIFAQAPTPATPGNPSPTPQAGENPHPENPPSNRAFLGVFVVPMRPAFGNPPGAGAGQQGVIVQMVAPDSPAEKVGLKQGDIIVSYHGQKLSSPLQLGQLVRADKPNESVTLQVERQNKLDNVQVTLGTAPAQEMGPGGMPGFGGPGSMPMMRPGFRNEMQSAWANFESLSIKNEGNGKFKLEAQYRENAAGATSAALKSYTFEGTPEEIHRKIEEAKDLNPGERMQLHRMLQLSGPGQGSPFPSMRPGFGGPPNPGSDGNP